MDIQYEKVINLLLLQEQIDDEFGVGWATGVSTEPLFDLAEPDAETMLIRVHVSRETITPDERQRLNAIIKAHDPAGKSQVQLQSEARVAARQQVLAMRFKSDDFAPELRPIIDHVNRLTALLQESER